MLFDILSTECAQIQFWYSFNKFNFGAFSFIFLKHKRKKEIEKKKLRSSKL